ncbi:dihydrofolate reductase [Gracilimonas mengyeensis]|uniref:Dihydrofolate reductase n=1 Tax=Gracilimonas mengyeensis TaxID=1302730 RepID=A0A521DTD1_9BACT|nr:dihydrofolate reductase [Gracilimonas mengyeensis]SMO74964.1 dihydrofolate reductase [Gracilimonas mengyeensis]
MILTLVVAHDPNLVIGKDGGLPWRYPEDLKHFKKTTTGGTIIMGRGVFEELNEIPLPKRRNIVLSSTRNYDNVDTYSSLEEALGTCDNEEIYIIGGGVLYREAIEKADKLIITEIHKEYDGDTFFPEYRDEIGSTWKEVSREDKGELSFVTYMRS